MDTAFHFITLFKKVYKLDLAIQKEEQIEILNNNMCTNVNNKSIEEIVKSIKKQIQKFFHGSLHLACLIYVSLGLAITKKKIFIEDETFKCMFYKIKYIYPLHT